MKRIIVEYSKLTKDILDMLIETYPDGYNYEDIISFKNAKGETVKAVELRTDDTIYLVKVSSKLENAMEEYAEDDEFFEDNDDFDVNLPDNKNDD
ncbi:MAG: hypothetical protein HWD82_11250 [Flavobacteriaceae bacterium]|nr:hypothetical protein [Flavobacteriaceae bacterium]